jgi:hypothetical protein
VVSGTKDSGFWFFDSNLTPATVKPTVAKVDPVGISEPAAAAIPNIIGIKITPLSK